MAFPKLDTMNIVVLVVALAALGLAVYNFMNVRKMTAVLATQQSNLDSNIRKMTAALATHHNILDHAEFDNLSPEIKAYYLSTVRTVMPEAMEYANALWKALPAYTKDPAKLKKGADTLKKYRPQITQGVTELISMMPPENTEYPFFFPPRFVDFVNPPAPKPTPPKAPKPVPKPLPFVRVSELKR